jgi:hypothetical protein
MTAKVLALSFYGILQHVEERLKRRDAMLRAVTAAAARRQLAVLEVWKQYTLHRREKRQGLTVAVLHASHLLHKRAFLAFCLHLEYRRQQQDKMMVAVNHVNTRRCRVVMKALAWHVSHAALKHQQMCRVVAHASKVYTWKAMRAWRYLMESMQHSHLLAQSHATHRVLSHALESMNLYATLRASNRKRELHVLKFQVRYWLRCTFWAWKVALQRQKKKRRSMKRSLAWHHRKVAKSAFSAWRQAAREAGVVRQRAEAMRASCEKRLLSYMLTGFQVAIYTFSALHRLGKEPVSAP